MNLGFRLIYPGVNKQVKKKDHFIFPSFELKLGISLIYIEDPVTP